jgi:hypothetical protein
MRFPLLFPAALLLAGCAATPLSQTPPAQVPATLTAPDIRVGDSWTYRITDRYTGFARGEERYEVTEVGPARIRVSVSGDSGDAVHVYDRGWNWLRRPATNLPTFEYSPAYKAMEFPLAAGARWRERLMATDVADGRRHPVWINGTVEGWERVTVPAGEFDALKIRRTVFFDYNVPTIRGRSEIVEYDWYVPAVRQVVRRETSSQYVTYIGGGSGGGSGAFVFLSVGMDNGGTPRFVPDDWLVYELVSHSRR